MANSSNLIKNINPNKTESWSESVFITMDFDWAIDEVLLYSIKLLEEYDWSGNVRELRNVIERLIILGGNPITKEDINLFASKK